MVFLPSCPIPFARRLLTPNLTPHPSHALPYRHTTLLSIPPLPPYPSFSLLLLLPLPLFFFFFFFGWDVPACDFFLGKHRILALHHRPVWITTTRIIFFSSSSTTPPSLHHPSLLPLLLPTLRLSLSKKRDADKGNRGGPRGGWVFARRAGGRGPG